MPLQIIKGGTVQSNGVHEHPLYEKVMSKLRALPDRDAESYLRGVSQVKPDSDLSRFIRRQLRSVTWQ